MASTRQTNSGTPWKDGSRQMVIDVSTVRDDVTDKAATIEAAMHANVKSANLSVPEQ
jgi:hypothetical protein